MSICSLANRRPVYGRNSNSYRAQNFISTVGKFPNQTKKSTLKFLLHFATPTTLRPFTRPEWLKQENTNKTRGTTSREFLFWFGETSSSVVYGMTRMWDHRLYKRKTRNKIKFPSVFFKSIPLFAFFGNINSKIGAIYSSGNANQYGYFQGQFQIDFLLDGDYWRHICNADVL